LAISKKYFDDNKKVIVTFQIPEDISVQFLECSVVGDFNNWNPFVHKLRRMNESSCFTLKVELPVNQVFGFKYLFNDNNWYIESESDGTITNIHGTQNSVLIT